MELKEREKLKKLKKNFKTKKKPIKKQNEKLGETREGEGEFPFLTNLINHLLILCTKSKARSGLKRRSLQPTPSTTSSTDSQFTYGQGSLMERAGATMEKWLESFFTSWGTCKFILLSI